LAKQIFHRHFAVVKEDAGRIAALDAQLLLRGPSAKARELAFNNECRNFLFDGAIRLFDGSLNILEKFAKIRLTLENYFLV
jgi:hypothetical protein